MESQASMAHRAKMFIGVFLKLLIDYFVENIGPVIKQCGWLIWVIGPASCLGHEIMLFIVLHERLISSNLSLKNVWNEYLIPVPYPPC